MEMYDLLLKGGHVIDPAGNIDCVMDVAVIGSNVALLEKDIPRHRAKKVIELKGYYVTPGLIDIHTHVFTFRSQDGYIEGMVADAHLLSSGVTTTVDAGTAGWKAFNEFKENCIDRSKTRILAFLNIASGGMVQKSTEQDPKEMHLEIVSAIAKTFDRVIVGIKSAHYWVNNPWDPDHPPWASVDNAVKAGELCGKPVMVDFWPRPPERPYEELILNRLRPGDIHTHVYGRPFPIIDRNGKVYDHMYKARSRGVLFDMGHGAGSFWFRNAVPAFQEGFFPDSISTDLHMGNINGPVVNMTTTMSKCLSMGMSLYETIARSTVIPAKMINRPELGTLKPGTEADIAVLRYIEGEFGFTDCGGAKMVGNCKIECVLTIRAGKIVYDPTGLSMPHWKEAPESYWITS